MSIYGIHKDIQSVEKDLYEIYYLTKEEIRSYGRYIFILMVNVLRIGVYNYLLYDNSKKI